jgi:hypothetical protein
MNKHDETGRVKDTTVHFSFDPVDFLGGDREVSRYTKGA